MTRFIEFLLWIEWALFSLWTYYRKV